MKKLLLLVFIFSFLFSCAMPALADGAFFIYDNDMWGLANEEKQFCAINHKNGIQNMILTIDTGQKLTGEKAVWVFPVPAKPEKIAINILHGFPKFDGYDIKSESEESLAEIFALMSLTQIYTMPFFAINFVFGTTESALKELTVHSSIEKMGLATELVSANNSSVMAKYFSSKGLEFPKTSQSLIDEYIGKDYSFVISWISDIDSFKKNQRTVNNDWEGWTGNAIGVFVSFPTEKLYYPLKLTSVYGDKAVPTVIYALGYVNPELYKEIKPYTKTNYYFANKIVISEELNDFFIGYKKEASASYSKNNTNKELAIKNIEYTKIELDPPSKYLKQDLWINKSVPVKIMLANSINKSKPFLFLLFFILFSCLASLLSGLITFQKKQIPKKALLFLGLWNFLTLIGFSLAAFGDSALKAAQLRTYHKNDFLYLKTIILSALVFGITFLFLTPYGRTPDPREMFRMYMASTVFALYSAFLILGYYSNNKIKRFITLFTFFFIILSFIAPFLIRFLI